MTSHIVVNKLGLTYKRTLGKSMATIPDVCKTPSPGGPVPIPYPNFADQSSLTDGTTTVFAKGKMIAIKGSHYSRSNGDEAGTAGGVKSGVNMKATDWITYSFDVKMDGKNACRHTDKKFHNNKNTVDLQGNFDPVAALQTMQDTLCDCVQTVRQQEAVDPSVTCTEYGNRVHDCCEAALATQPDCGGERGYNNKTKQRFTDPNTNQPLTRAQAEANNVSFRGVSFPDACALDFERGRCAVFRLQDNLPKGERAHRQPGKHPIRPEGRFNEGVGQRDRKLRQCHDRVHTGRKEIPVLAVQEHWRFSHAPDPSRSGHCARCRMPMKELQIHRPKLFEGSLTAPCVRISCFLPTGVESTAVANAVSRYFSLIPDDVVLKRILVDEVEDEGEPSGSRCPICRAFPGFPGRSFGRIRRGVQSNRRLGARRPLCPAVRPRTDRVLGAVVLCPAARSGFRQLAQPAELRPELLFAQSRIEDVYRFVADIASAFPDCCLTAAAAINFPAGLDQLLMSDINARLFRFIALDANYHATHYTIGDRVPCAAWLTYLNQSQMEQVGGLAEHQRGTCKGIPAGPGQRCAVACGAVAADRRRQSRSSGHRLAAKIRPPACRCYLQGSGDLPALLIRGRRTMVRSVHRSGRQGMENADLVPYGKNDERSTRARQAGPAARRNSRR